MARGRGFLDVQTPFFYPMWRRVVAVVVLTIWTLFEVSNGQVFWSILFGASGAYLAWQFFFVWNPDGEGD
ncbi:hypothetical protein SAMN05444004_11683 [Jannaschia faecimaris]|uniref:DUF3329 domain-containing protein n=1 Tax=Jannaschia faecimaris TaxID=1244108 RepID=A0A1H3TEN3_9RHOB|nr:hypothetical protein [Jannaschia faecimaris]SDZ48560.1 hypothetical protein SAMN05444004_11683 [Jannaschia faecimaris]